MEKKEKTKKTSSRSKKKHKNIDKRYNLALRQEYMDVDYVNGVKNAKGELVIRPMTDEEKTWLDNFYKEDLNASIDKNNPKFYDTEKARKDSYNRNNQRNRCLYNREKAQGKLIDLDADVLDNYIGKYIQNSPIDPEEILIRQIDGRGYEDDED